MNHGNNFFNTLDGLIGLVQHTLKLGELTQIKHLNNLISADSIKPSDKSRPWSAGICRIGFNLRLRSTAAGHALDRSATALAKGMAA
jgi:hypothetical protein